MMDIVVSREDLKNSDPLRMLIALIVEPSIVRSLEISSIPCFVTFKFKMLVFAI